MTPADIRIGSLWFGSGRHQHMVHEIVAITKNSVKIRAVNGASRGQRDKLATVPTDKFLKSHRPR